MIEAKQAKEVKKTKVVEPVKETSEE